MIKIKGKIGTPKYKQIIHSIEEAILAGALKKGDQIPSINKIKDENKLSRDTVLTAFNELKNRGIIQSIVGKGYYVSSENINITQKIFLLFDELNSFKEDLYNSFIANLGDNVQVDIFFHHFNFDVFSKIIYDNIGVYNHYVIMPANMKNTGQVIEKLPNGKVYILDQTHEDLLGYSGVFQNFEKDIYENLLKSKYLIDKYEKLILLFSKEKQSQGMLNGFVSFAEDYEINHEVISTLEGRNIERGDVYVIPDDRNLLRIIKKMKLEGFILAKDIGIVSYNDTLLKEIVEGGITTISTDFNKMGATLAHMVLNKETLRIENPNDLIIRNSL